VREETGAATSLAIFMVFVILISVVTVRTFEEGYQRQLSLFNQSMSIDTTRAVAAAVQTELNDALVTAVQAAMYESGIRGEDKSYVENRLRQYFNQRISAGWEYSNFREIQVSLSDENFLFTEWTPDGGLRAYGYLNATFEHLSGTKAFGIKLDAGVVPRYGRLYHLAHLVFDEAKTVSDIGAYETELNENYYSERLEFTLVPTDEGASVTIHDRYGGRAIAGD
jgi:hypothetical protein